MSANPRHRWLGEWDRQVCVHPGCGVHRRLKPGTRDGWQYRFVGVGHRVGHWEDERVCCIEPSIRRDDEREQRLRAAGG